MLIATKEDDHLLALREVILPEALKRLNVGGRNGMSQDDLASWLIRKHRGRVIAVLGCCISDALERHDDNSKFWRVVKNMEDEITDATGEDFEKGDPPEIAALIQVVRDISDSFGLPRWYLLERVGLNRIMQLHDAVSLVLELREEILAVQREAMLALQEMIAPIVHGRAPGTPEPTVKEALRLLEEQTAETLHNLEKPDDV